VWDWIAGLAGQTWGNINQLYQYILRIIQGVIGWIAAQLDFISAEITSIWSFIANLSSQIWGFVSGVVVSIETALVLMAQNFTGWVTGLISDLRNYADWVYSTLAGSIGALYGNVRQWISGVQQWALNNIWNPLHDFAAGMFTQLLNLSNFVYGLLGHPDRLAALLAQYLWLSWLDLLKSYSGAIGRWLVRSMLGMAGEVVDVLESIIAALI